MHCGRWWHCAGRGPTATPAPGPPRRCARLGSTPWVATSRYGGAMTTPQDDHADQQEQAATRPGTLGDSRVDAAVARLHDLQDRPVGEHVEVYDDIHARLRDALEDAAVEPASPQQP